MELPEVTISFMVRSTTTNIMERDSLGIRAAVCFSVVKAIARPGAETTRVSFSRPGFKQEPIDFAT